MPIRAEERGRYPPDWPRISNRIRFERAGGRCECAGECGTRCVERDIEGSRCPNRHGLPAARSGRIVVLTTAHLDHTPENVSDENLKAMCQACHNAYDAEHRKATRAAQRRRDLAEQMDTLFGE